MATFCHFHPKDLKKVKKVANYITDTINNDHFKIGLDQKALTDVYKTFTKLSKTWIRHHDVKTDDDKIQHNQCLIYHEKGRRGKL